jgi:hypothetical protein
MSERKRSARHAATCRRICEGGAGRSSRIGSAGNSDHGEASLQLTRARARGRRCARAGVTSSIGQRRTPPARPWVCSTFPDLNPNPSPTEVAAVNCRRTGGGERAVLMVGPSRIGRGNWPRSSIERSFFFGNGQITPDVLMVAVVAGAWGACYHSWRMLFLPLPSHANAEEAGCAAPQRAGS